MMEKLGNFSNKPDKPPFQHTSIEWTTLLLISAASGTRKPENPNFENGTRQTRTRTFVKMSNPTKPEPEVQTRGYPMT